MLLGGLELVVFLEHRRSVILRRFEHIELYRALRAIGLVIVLDGHRAVTLMHAVEVRCQKLGIAAYLVALGAFLQLLPLEAELSRNAVALGFDVVAELLRAPAAAFKRIAL